MGELNREQWKMIADVVAEEVNMLYNICFDDRQSDMTEEEKKDCLDRRIKFMAISGVIDEILEALKR